MALIIHLAIRLFVSFQPNNTLSQGEFKKATA